MFFYSYIYVFNYNHSNFVNSKKNTMSKSGIKVFTPAVLYNLNSSINPLNICLSSIGTEMIVSRETTEKNISIIGVKNKEIKKQIESIVENNIQFIIQNWKLDISPIEIKIEIKLKMPEDSSLGLFESIINNLYFGISNLFKLGFSKRELLEIIQKNKDNQVNLKALSTGSLGGIHIIMNEEIHRIPVLKGLSIGLVYSNLFEVNSKKNNLRKKDIAKTNLLLSHSLHTGNIELLKSTFKRLQGINKIEIRCDENLIDLENKTDNIGTGFTKNHHTFYSINQNTLTTEFYNNELSRKLNDKTAMVYKCGIDLEGTELL